MEPQIEFMKREHDSLYFRFSGVNVSIANALRRTLLSDIPVVVFRTSPNEKNQCVFETNTSRYNNEILKHRLSCIPIHITNQDRHPIHNYLLEVNVENTSDTTMIVTTEHFKIKDVAQNKYLPQDMVKEIFPTDLMTGQYIDFVRLRPKISNDIPGEHVHFTCKFDIGKAMEDAVYNVVSTCSYKFTEDQAAQDAELVKKRQTWKEEGKTEAEIQFESKNWKLLEAKRLYKKDSFDFVLETIGIYSNEELLQLACNSLITNLKKVQQRVEKDEMVIQKSMTTLKNSFDMVLENYEDNLDYTLGKILEYLFYTKYYETKVATFCGFTKLHPHDNSSIIRVAYTDPVDKSVVKGHLAECIDIGIQIYTHCQKKFAKL